MKESKNGFSLLEVMIAGAIGMGIFLFLNNTIIKLQKTQKKMEKRGEVDLIKWTLKKHLSDVRAWEENPELKVPTPSNDSNFYYYPKGRSNLDQFTVVDEDYRFYEKNFKCRDGLHGCRVALINYNGQIIHPTAIKRRPKKHFIAQIGFEDKDTEINRSFLPELLVYLTDTEEDYELKVNDQKFYVNAFGNNKDMLSNQNDINVIDPNNRANCFIKFLEMYPEQQDIGKQLCSKATSSMPADCFIKMKDELSVSDLIALVTCTRAKNPKPMTCYKYGIDKFGEEGRNIAVLCSGATSLMPLDCLDKIKNDVGLGHPKGYEFLVCARSNDLSPADCYTKIHKKGTKYIDQVINLCVSFK